MNVKKKWTREETLLALELYLSNGRVGMNHTSQLQVSIAKQYIEHPLELFKVIDRIKEQLGISADH